MKCLAPASVLLALSFGIAACGQKGPLVLPDAQPKHKHSVPPLSSPVTPHDSGHGPGPQNPAPAAPSAPDQPAAAPTPPIPSSNGAAAATLTTPR